MRALSDRGSADGIGRPGLLEKAASRFRRRDGGAVFRLLRVLDVCYVAAIAYVCARALDPALGTGASPWLESFGSPATGRRSPWCWRCPHSTWCCADWPERKQAPARRCW